ncbi:hypothetical protein BC829DRAFT_408569 [Chytridium lagenaria]|nr:hypothetical protein BC829DRAFT_408569 [Chytridium lagenaria]
MPEDALLDPAAFAKDELTLPEKIKRQGKKKKRKARAGSEARTGGDSASQGDVNPGQEDDEAKGAAEDEEVEGSMTPATPVGNTPTLTSLFWRAAAGEHGGEEGSTTAPAASSGSNGTPGVPFFPLVIELQALDKKNASSSLETLMEEPGMPSVNSQATYATLIPSKDGQTFDLKVLKQKVVIDNTSFTLQDIYGFTDPQSMRECVICMSEPKDTIVLPCRHLCLCRDCAEVLRFQGRRRGQNTAQARSTGSAGPPRCPICRQAFHSLLQINLPKPFKLEKAVSSVHIASSGASATGVGPSSAAKAGAKAAVSTATVHSGVNASAEVEESDGRNQNVVQEVL